MRRSPLRLGEGAKNDAESRGVEMGVSVVMGVPKMVGLYHGKSQSKMDGNGKPYEN